MNLESLSDADLMALKSGDLTKVSDAGLMALKTPKQDPGAMALEGLGGMEKFRIGMGKSVADLGRGVGQILGITPQADIDAAKVRDAALMSDGAGLAGDITGNVLATMIPGIGAQRLLTQGATRVLPRMLAPTAGAVAGGASITAATTPIASDESRLTTAAMGGAGAGIGDLAVRGAARVVRPMMQSGPVQQLLAEGIVPTPGQAAGANSIWGKVEQKLQSIPIVGDIIRRGRDRAGDEFNAAAIARATPAGMQIQGTGRPAIHAADQVLHQGYEDVINRIGTVRVEPTFARAAQDAIANPDLALPATAQKRLMEIVQTQILDRSPSQTMSADLAKRADAQLGMLARTYSVAKDGDQRMLANGIREVQRAWRDNIRSNASPALAADLDELNRAFANFVRVERAAGMQGARGGVFTPQQLQSAVRATDTSARKGQFAQGNALMQDLTDPASATLSQTVPNSGTVDRALIGFGLGGSAAGANEYFGGPGYLSALALSPLLYSRAGSRYMLGNLPGQQGIAGALNATAPVASQIGRVSLLDILQRK